MWVFVLNYMTLMFSCVLWHTQLQKSKLEYENTLFSIQLYLEHNVDLPPLPDLLLLHADQQLHPQLACHPSKSLVTPWGKSKVDR